MTKVTGTIIQLGATLDMEFIVDEDITLRLLATSDAETLFELVDQNRSYLRQWLPWLDHSTTIEHSRIFINSIHEQLLSKKGFACGVFVMDRLVGMCGFHEIDNENQTVVIGYWLSEDHQGRGIISRCTNFFINYAFDELGLQKVFIPVAEQNTKSRAVCERLGLTSEEIQVNAENLYGNLVNHVRYAMTKDKRLKSP